MNDNIVELEHKWFVGHCSCVGVVFAFDRELDIYHGYIGVGDGISKDRDIFLIIDNGCRLTQEETFAMIGSNKARKLISSIPAERWKNP